MQYILKYSGTRFLCPLKIKITPFHGGFIVESEHRRKKKIDLILKFVWLEMSMFSLLEVTVLYS